MFPFLVGMVGRRRVARAVSANLRPIAGSLRASGDRNAAKDAFLGSLLRGLVEADVRAAGERFAASERYRLRPEVVRMLRWHQRSGHDVLVVSAGLEVYIEPLVGRLGVSNVIATRLAVRDGLLTGAVEGRNVRGFEKLRRLRDVSEGLPDRIVAYGNASSDLELLRGVGHGVWCGARWAVHRDLLSIARQERPLPSVLAQRLSSQSCERAPGAP